MSARQCLTFVVIALVALVLYLLFWPVAINPAAWNSPIAPSLSGSFQQNSLLATTERLPLETGYAPEDVAIDSGGRIYTGIDDGRILRFQADGKHPQTFANTQGRPLGLAFDRQGDLIVADAVKGLLSISRDGSKVVLATEAAGTPFGCTNDLAVAADGTIYFTDASSKFPLTDYKTDLIEHQPHGRLLAYDPDSKSVEVVLDGLYFANGVAVNPDQSFLLVAETGEYRIRRLWLSGSEKGKSDTFIDNLPGFPDGISTNGKDKFWLALAAPRDRTLDMLLPHPFLRRTIMRLPKFFQPAPMRYSFVIALDASGHVIQNLQDGSPNCYAQIANVVEHEGTLYFGSIGERAIGRFKLP
jgi:sugar lactone lactonase YvrE